MSQRFTRTIENFTCENCGLAVKGNGYTNHCPKCLWSKHVDVFPGDRAESCQGMMKPVGLDKKNGALYIKQKCEKCGISRVIRTAKDDNFNEILKLS